MGPQFFRFANTIFLFHRRLGNNCLHSQWTQGADERRMHSSTYCSLHSVYEWNKPLLPLPCPFAHRAPPNASSRSPCKNTSSLSYKVSQGTKQAFQYLAFNLFSITTFTVPFNILTFSWYSFCCIYCVSQFHFRLGFFPFNASFPWEKGGVPL